MKKNTLLNKMHEEWGGIWNFHRATKPPLALETCRRIIADATPSSAISFVVVAYALGYSPTEIRDMLQDKTNPYLLKRPSGQETAKILAALISTDVGVVLTDEDKLVLSIWRKMKTNKQITETFAPLMGLLSPAGGEE